MEEGAIKDAGSPSEAEKRDDAETVGLLYPESRLEGSSGEVATEVDEGGDGSNEMNITRFDDDDDDSKIDLNSVLSGNMEDEIDGHPEGVFGKNLGAIFDDAKEMETHLNPPFAAESDTSFAKATKQGNSNNVSRPPLAPGRTATVGNASLKSNSSDPNASDHRATAPNAVSQAQDKRLPVFLRVRPPVCANGKKGNEGSINTIEVIPENSDSSKSPPLPKTIRTYPPPNSNAAKVVRGKHATSDALLKNALFSKSLLEDGSSDNGVDLRAEVRGVKEYSYSGVFGPDATQSEVYRNVAAPLVDGLFPQAGVEEAQGESALLFTMGVTNAGKTHTVMGTGFGTKASKKKMQKCDIAVNEEWGIIPRSLDHMLFRINSVNEKSSTGPRLQMYMSYLEIYNEQIYDLLPNKSDAPKRPCDGPPALKLRESRRGRIFVRGLARHAVRNVQQGLELAQVAKSNRHTASNNINANSSRSHSICQMEVSQLPSNNGKLSGHMDAVVDSECETDDDSMCSKSGSDVCRVKRHKSTIIWIVDLAGSERSKKTRTHTRHQKEAALINASLMNLMRCLREMLNYQPKKRGTSSIGGGGGVVPFRDSKLSHMFMNHLTGPAASRTAMIVNVNPAADDYDETQHVLGYAATARSVTISAVDYNRKRRLFVKESKVKMSPKKALCRIAKKISPKKRNGGNKTNPRAKRLRSNSHTISAASRNNTLTRAGGVARKPTPKHAEAVKNHQLDDGILDQLREENFSLKVSVDCLRQQLADCEAEIRKEVVETMSASLDDSKSYYENRILLLQQQIKSAHYGSQAEMDHNSQAEFLERIDECEEEMKRMREDHKAELESLSAAHLHLARDHEAAIEILTKEQAERLSAEEAKSKRLGDEVGKLRHWSSELQASHNSLLAKYNSLVATQQSHEDTSLPLSHNEKENPTAVAIYMNKGNQSSLEAPRETDIDILSPKKKQGGWFMRSPAKVGTEGGKISPAKASGNTRSPLGRLNKK